MNELGVTVLKPNFAIVPLVGSGTLTVVVRAQQPLQSSAHLAPRPS